MFLAKAAKNVQVSGDVFCLKLLFFWWKITLFPIYNTADLQLGLLVLISDPAVL